MKPKTGHERTARQLSLTSTAIGQAIIIIILYCILLFALPVGQDQVIGSYKLSALEYKIIRFALSIPTMAVWFTAFIGFSTLRRYAELIKKNGEGEHYSRLADGCAWLAWSLPITSTVSLILNTIAFEAPSFLHTDIIISNYISLIFSVIAFTIISTVSGRLVSASKLNIRSSSAPLMIFLFVAAGVVYCFFTFSQFQSTGFGATDNPYFLPIWLVVLSVIVPYLYVWFVGLLASYEITLYGKNTAGVLYRRALRTMVYGLVTILGSSIILQYLNGMEPPNGHLMLNYKLLLTVIFRIISALGFIVLTIGAQRLRRIEEV